MIKITRNFRLEKWDSSIEQLIISYWENRKIKFDIKAENHYQGERGTLLGNLSSFNMLNLMTKIDIIRNEQNDITCELYIKSFGQIITKLNKEFWALELDTFESVLSHNNHKEKEWDSYNKRASKENRLYMVISFIIGILIYSLIKIFT